ncbi:MAG TPA: hypothetical protein VJ729_00710 [Nitrososphaeraceae archaeon]|nr:hypothetical protein [Nitrososphaeraceae archaeon]
MSRILLFILRGNSRVANELTSALNCLKYASSSTTGADPTNDIKTKMDRINGLLGEAMSSRVPKEIVNNAKNTGFSPS